MNKIIFSQKDYRIVQTSPDTCLVEVFKEPGIWIASDDNSFCANAYMKAFIFYRNCSMYENEMK